MGQMVTLIFRATARLFPEAESFYIPTSYVRRFQFLYIINNTYLSYFIITILVGVKWNLTMVLICISLMANDVDHLYLCLLVICFFYLEKRLFISFDHLLIGLSFY